MYNFKLNFLSRGHLESLNLDKIFLPSKYYHAMKFFSNLIFVIIARMLCGNTLNEFERFISLSVQETYPFSVTHLICFLLSSSLCGSF